MILKKYLPQTFVLTVVTFLFFSLQLTTADAQVSKNSKLYQEIKAQDSLLFTIGFNTCDVGQFDRLLTADFKMFHDKAGITATKEEFLKGIKDGLCKMNYKAERQLVPESMIVYPLEKNGVLYGAIQVADHKFYGIEPNKPKYLTSVAKITHLWLLENGVWKLAQSLSYDHREK